MSATLMLDDLEGARDEVRDAVMAILGVAITNANARDELTAAIFDLGSVHLTIERAIDAMGGPVEETP